MKKKILLIILTIFVGVLLADWDPGDDYKMHFPQLPDPTGWDVNITSPQMLADDWQCTETGPIRNIHFWGSSYSDIYGVEDNINIRIYSDIPNGPDGYSIPDQLLWERDFGQGEFTGRHYGTGLQGWYDPDPINPLIIPDDHNNFGQMNITNINDPFIQIENTIYWMSVSITLVQGSTELDGAKTSLDHFNDDAVYWDSINLKWTRLINPPAFDPPYDEHMDLAFVFYRRRTITGRTLVLHCFLS